MSIASTSEHFEPQFDALAGDKHCFHCGQNIPDHLDLSIVLHGERKSVCCYGCQTVANTIIDFGMHDYYQYRDGFPAQPKEIIPEELESLKIFNNAKLQKEWLNENTEGIKEIHLVLEGIVCPACTWLIEKTLLSKQGIRACNVNYTNSRALLSWDETLIELDHILLLIKKLGYEAWPYKPETEILVSEKERKAQLWRLGLCGILGMQVMMISIALYFGDYSGIDTEYRQVFYWLNMAFTTPVLFISGMPFIKGAVRDIRHLRPGMDLPVTLGLITAYLGSVGSTLKGSGDVYYDSVIMFIFLLSLSRYVEFMQRRKSTQEITQDNRLIPAMTTRLEKEPTGQISKQVTAVIDLCKGDRILVKAGENIPTDGIVRNGICHVNESMLTGESLPVKKCFGDQVIAGTVNTDSPIEVEVDKTGDETVLASIYRLIEEAQNKRPHHLTVINKMASVFISFVIIITAVSAIYYFNSEPEKWLLIVISVLVVTCPCALSMAVPTAHAATLARLLKEGIILKNPDVLDTVDAIDDIIFDKTGTLTQSKIELDRVYTNRHIDEMTCIEIAAALEAYSEHPIAQAFKNRSQLLYQAEQIVNHPGKGISGVVNTKNFHLGSKLLIPSNDYGSIVFEQEPNEIVVYLSEHNDVLAAFILRDQLKTDAIDIIQLLKKQPYQLHLLSGDRQQTTKSVANKLAIPHYQAAVSPSEKHNYVARLQEQNRKVLMIGDGINDAPVLAQADISIAIGQGADIARMNADLIFMNPKLNSILKLLEIGKKNNAIIKQSILWAIIYNLSALPLAVSGYLLPWIAAIGMSLSSLIVVLNARRINK